MRELGEGVALLALGVWMLVRLRVNVERVARLGKRIEERRRRMRDFRQRINAMRWEQLAAERKRLRARQRRERGRGSDGLELVNFRLKLVEARMREVARQKEAPGAMSIDPGGG